MPATVLRLLLSLGLALSAAACSPQQETGSAAGASIRQTQFPGQVSAGGATSGQLMSQAGKIKDEPETEGTPGIPQGSGGNTGGAAMGGEARGTSPVEGDEHQKSANDVAPSPEPANPASNTVAQPQQEAVADEKSEAKRKAEAKAEREKQELEASMDAVTERWRIRAANNDWEPPSPPLVDTTAGVAGQPGSVPPQFMRSEKHGSAPASSDIKPAPTPGPKSGTP